MRVYGYILTSKADARGAGRVVDGVGLAARKVVHHYDAGLSLLGEKDSDGWMEEEEREGRSLDG